MQQFDAIIIGAGQSGMPLAKKIAGLGLKVALVEKRVIGGTCINDGCSPTKTMVASARVAHLVKRAHDFGINVHGFDIDQAKIKDRKNKIVELFRGGAEKALGNTKNLTIIMGMARFTGCREIEVILEGTKVQELTAPKIFIDTGAEPVVPAIEGLETVPFLNSTTIMELEETPDHLLILGGGYIGLEFSQMFRRFGSKVTILDNGPHLVPKEDSDVCEEVSNVFNKEGIETLFNVKVKKVTHSGTKITLNYSVDGKEKTISGSHLLVAVGRKPTTGNLQLEKSGIDIDDKGDILVNNYHETSCEGVYALGDVVGETPFTHMAYHDAHNVFKCVYENEKISKVDRLMPYCIFIDPQLARVGLNEKQAKEQGIVYEVGKYWMKHAGRPLEVDEKEGFFKVLVNPKNRMILGATILSIDAGEIIATIQMAMLGGISADVIQHLPIAHPTLAENLNNVMGMIGKK
jgi:pyruvate/2-oxoglutarate dehydrogenase complex dihydrolipoamide dehydrogenase (E3) component